MRVRSRPHAPFYIAARYRSTANGFNFPTKFSWQISNSPVISVNRNKSYKQINQMLILSEIILAKQKKKKFTFNSCIILRRKITTTRDRDDFRKSIISILLCKTHYIRFCWYRWYYRLFLEQLRRTVSETICFSSKRTVPQLKSYLKCCFPFKTCYLS